MGKVPNTTTFTLQDVCNSIYGDANSGRNLSDCNNYSLTYGTFDPAYIGLSGMGRYRNYNPLSVGASFLGGKIAYLDNSGEHGFVVALSDQSSGIVWSSVADHITASGNDTLNGATGIYGTTGSFGYSNTNTITSHFGVDDYAASLCKQLTTGGSIPGTLSQWYLPSISELIHISTVNNTLSGALLGTLIATYYWSSTTITDASGRWVLMSNGTFGTAPKTTHYGVRAIRGF